MRKRVEELEVGAEVRETDQVTALKKEVEDLHKILANTERLFGGNAY
jgi:hypothetical protein